MNQPHHEAERLAACPFGCVRHPEPDASPYLVRRDDGCFVKCIECYAEGPWAALDTVAINAWNARRPTPAEPSLPQTEHEWEQVGFTVEASVADIVILRRCGSKQPVPNALVPTTPGAQDVEGLCAEAEAWLPSANIGPYGREYLLRFVGMVRTLTADLAAREAEAVRRDATIHKLTDHRDQETARLETAEATIAEQAGEIARLKAECFALAARVCANLTGDEHGNPVCADTGRHLFSNGDSDQ